MSEHGHDGVGPPPQHHGLPPAGLLQPHGLAAPALRGLAPAPVPATAAAHRAVTPAHRHQQILSTCDRYFYFPHRLKVGMMARGSGWGTEAMTTRGAVTSWATPGRTRVMDTCLSTWQLTYGRVGGGVLVVTHHSLLDKHSESIGEDKVQKTYNE